VTPIFISSSPSSLRLPRDSQSPYSIHVQRTKMGCISGVQLQGNTLPAGQAHYISYT